MDLKEIDLIGNAIDQHWYYRCKAKAIRRFLPERPAVSLLDIGSGSGFFARYLLSNTGIEEAACVDINYPVDSEDSQTGKLLQFKRQLEQSHADLVLMIDVLEHIEDDVGFLKSWVDKLPYGSYFIISVPAFQSLWSGHDVFLEHKRRYTLAQIEKVVRCAGLQVERSSYFFAAVFPLAAAIRLFQKLVGKTLVKPASQLKKHHPAINAILTYASEAELPLLQHNRLFGLTAFCLAKKPVACVSG